MSRQIPQPIRMSRFQSVKMNQDCNNLQDRNMMINIVASSEEFSYLYEIINEEFNNSMSQEGTDLLALFDDIHDYDNILTQIDEVREITTEECSIQLTIPQCLKLNRIISKASTSIQKRLQSIKSKSSELKWAIV